MCIGEFAMRRRKIQDGSAEALNKRLPLVHKLPRNFNLREWKIAFDHRRPMLPLVTVGRDEIGAVSGAIECYFTLGAAADGADFLTLCGTEAFCAAFAAD